VFSHRMIERLRRAKRVVVITGAGISAESGVPTFRGADGLWKRYRVEDLATPHAFRRDPRLVWEWYDWRRRLIFGKEPNAGHVAIAAMEGFF
jgi:NAD-dependent deacetylase